MSGTLAQSVEQRTFNPLVTSSNLVRPTTHTKPLLKRLFFARQPYGMPQCLVAWRPYLRLHGRGLYVGGTSKITLGGVDLEALPGHHHPTPTILHAP